MSVLADVLRETDGGRTAAGVAARLGLPDDLVELALEHAERLGLVMRPAGGAASGCGGGACAAAGPTTSRPLPSSCAGCPLAR
jgi:hypothetical protein